MDIGAKIIRAFCAQGEVYAFIQAKLEDKYFYSEDEKQVFNFVNNHVNNYHTLPQEQTLLEKFPELPEAIEPTLYYLDKIIERYTHKTMNMALSEVSVLLEDKQVPIAFQKIQEMLGNILQTQTRTKIVDFGKDALAIITHEYNNAKSNPTGILFGWEYLDDMTMGLFAGDVASYVGRPAQGKTFQMLYTAHNAWKVQGKRVMFVSMEMAIPPLAQRIAAITAKVSSTELKKGLLPTLPKNVWVETQNVLLKQQSMDNPFWLIDGNLTSTPEQIYTLANQFQPDIVFIDGAYLLKSTNKRLDRFTRVAENIEYIKQASSSIAIPSTLSYQFNREASKKKGDETPGLEDIAFSDAIGQISSIILGLFEKDSVETLCRKRVNVLKGREGAIGHYYINWDFKKMDFSQIPNEEISPETGYHPYQLGYI